MLGPALALLLTAGAPAGAELTVVPPPEPEAPEWSSPPVSSAPVIDRALARERAARSAAIVGASLVLGAGYAVVAVDGVLAAVDCGSWSFIQAAPECESSASTRRDVLRGVFVGLVLVPPVLAARAVARADPEASATRAFWRGLPWHLAGAAVTALAPRVFRSEALGGVAVLGAGAALGLYLSPRMAAGGHVRTPPPVALALPVRDPALLR